jgi:tetratricopeptide (TPR) repeat protein
MYRWFSIFVFVTACATGFAPWQASGDLEPLLLQHRAQPSDWKLCNQIAMAYTQAQQFDAAASFYRKVLLLNPAFVPARKNLGVVLWFADRKSEAEKIFRGLLTVIPQDVVPHLYVGLALYDRRQFAEAKRQFSQAGDLALQNPETLPVVVDTYLSAQDESIVPHALQFSHETSDSGLAVKLAAVFNRHGQYQATVKILENKPALEPDGFAVLAEAWEKQNKPERAFEILAEAIAAHPDQEAGYTTLAAFASAHHNDAYALKIVEQGLERNPGFAVLLLQRGLLTAFAGDREAARKNFRAANQAKPQWSLPLLALGIVELEAGQMVQAGEVFQDAIRVAPDEARGYYFSALAQSRRAEPDRADALKMLRKALAIDPNHTSSRVLLGQLEISVGRLQEGAAELERALRSDRTNKSALYQLALASRKLGRTAAAQKYMAEFTALKHQDEQDQTALVQIMKIIK